LRNLPDASHIVISFSFVTGRRRRDNKCERGRKEEVEVEVEVEIKWVALLVYPSISRDGRETTNMSEGWEEATHLKPN
jgi:hypothetical protein